MLLAKAPLRTGISYCDYHTFTLQGLKDIFELIIKDEENHREIMNSIEELYVAEEIMKNNTPVVKYQHLEVW